MSIGLEYWWVVCNEMVVSIVINSLIFVVIIWFVDVVFL